MYTQDEKDDIRKRCEQNRDKHRSEQQGQKQEHSAMWNKLASSSGGGASGGQNRSVQNPKADGEMKSAVDGDRQKEVEREANERREKNLKFHEAQQNYAQQQRNQGR